MPVEAWLDGVLLQIVAVVAWCEVLSETGLCVPGAAVLAVPVDFYAAHSDCVLVEVRYFRGEGDSPPWYCCGVFARVADEAGVVLRQECG